MEVKVKGKNEYSRNAVSIGATRDLWSSEPYHDPDVLDKTYLNTSESSFTPLLAFPCQL